jgi:hypothetical protein
MNHSFLLPSPRRLDQAMQHDGAQGGGRWDLATRRRFLKLTGAATVASMISIQRSRASDPGNKDHCPVHGSYCTYISAITVHFTSTSVPPAVEGMTASGRVFHGTITYTSTYCKTGKVTERSYPVKSGGYRSSGSAVTQGNDTTCPGGTFDGTPDTGTPGPDNQVEGFPVATGGGRTGIEIHGPGCSEGCIVFEDEDDWDTFAPEMRCNNYSNCVHDIENPVPVTVTYAPSITPVGNAPG